MHRFLDQPFVADPSSSHFASLPLRDSKVAFPVFTFSFDFLFFFYPSVRPCHCGRTSLFLPPLFSSSSYLRTFSSLRSDGLLRSASLKPVRHDHHLSACSLSVHSSGTERTNPVKCFKLLANFLFVTSSNHIQALLPQLLHSPSVYHINGAEYFLDRGPVSFRIIEPVNCLDQFRSQHRGPAHTTVSHISSQLEGLAASYPVCASILGINHAQTFSRVVGVIKTQFDLPFIRFACRDIDRLQFTFPSSNSFSNFPFP